VTPDEKTHQLLLCETEHVNKQISSYMDLQIKLLTFVFAAIGGSLGLLFAVGPKPDSDRAAEILLVISLLGSFGILQSVITYGIALTHIDYKTNVLGPKWQKLLGLDYAPFGAAERFRTSPVKKPALMATFFLFFGSAIANVAVVVYLVPTAPKSGTWMCFGVATAAFMAGAALVSRLFLRPAMKAAGIVS
jgi:hypothetical protein